MTESQCVEAETEVLAEVEAIRRVVDGYARPGTQQNEQARKFLSAAVSLAGRWREDPAFLRHAASKCAAAMTVLRP
jgi:hypothetical protein